MTHPVSDGFHIYLIRVLVIIFSDRSWWMWSDPKKRAMEHKVRGGVLLWLPFLNFHVYGEQQSHHKMTPWTVTSEAQRFTPFCDRGSSKSWVSKSVMFFLCELVKGNNRVLLLYLANRGNMDRIWGKCLEWDVGEGEERTGFEAWRKFKSGSKSFYL